MVTLHTQSSETVRGDRRVSTNVGRRYGILYSGITVPQIVEIVEHCLLEPVEKLGLLREQFHESIHNFADVRNFELVEKCSDNLPDEVATAHCMLHQAVL